MTDFKIIENTKEARKEYGEMYGANEIALTNKEIKALCEGKCIATNDGEYVTFLTLKRCD